MMRTRGAASAVLAALALGACSAPSADSEVVTVTETEDLTVVVEEPVTTETKTVTAKPTGRPSSSSSLKSPKASSTSSSTSQAATALAGLPVKGRAPKTGYDRDLFGQAWSDDVAEQYGRNGCDTRNDILKRDLTGVTIKPGTNDCVILTGTLADPFTGSNISFTRGVGSSMAVQIDHVVALSNAWQTGAQQLGVDQRQNFANDPLNLLAVDGPTNSSKGDGDAATWLPPNKSFRCDYAARQIAVKKKHNLWVTPPEKDALEGLISSCPGEPLPSR